MRSRITFQPLLISSFALLVTFNTVSNVWADTPEPEASGDAPIEPITLHAGRASDYSFIGESRDRLGAGLAFGDLDGDGQGDLVIGVSGASVPDTVEPQTGYETGAIWVPNIVLRLDSVVDSTLLAAVVASDDLVAYGPGRSQRVGSALAMGDLNGDGQADLVVGNPNHFENGYRFGAVYILFGPKEFDRGFVADIADLTYLGASERRIGLRVAVGDLNNDGIDDLVMTYKPGPESRQDGIEIFFGPLDRESRDSLDNPDVSVLRSNREHQGEASLAIGDLNGDELDDLVIGLPSAPGGGQVFVGFGPLFPGTVEIEDLKGLSFTGAEANQALGTASAIGDLDGDGWNDLVTSDRFAMIGDNSSAGAVYVFRGPIGPTDEVRIAEADIVIEGDVVRGRLGSSLVVADLDNDGVQDLVIGADELDVRGQDNAGRVYILIGDVFTPEPTPDSSMSPMDVLYSLPKIALWLQVVGGVAVMVGAVIWVVLRSPPLLGGGIPDHKDDPNSRRWF